MTMKTLTKCLTTKMEDFDLPKIPVDDGILYYKDNGCNVLGVAHLDYVDYAEPKYSGSVVQCPQLDDRLGVWMLLHLLPEMGINLDILLTDDEECGDSTGQWFYPHKQYNWIIEFDRAGTDIVFYQYREFGKYWRNIRHGHGTFSDISLMSHLGAMAANIGIGYYQQHTQHCFADLKTTRRQAKKFADFYRENKDKKFPYIPQAKKKSQKRKKRNKKNAFDRYYNYCDDRMFLHRAAAWEIGGVERCELCGIYDYGNYLVETYDCGQQIMCGDCYADYRKYEDKQNAELDAMYYRAKKSRMKF